MAEPGRSHVHWPPPMSSRSWAWCALVLFAGCATGGDAVKPKHRPAPVPVAASDDDDDDDEAPKPLAPPPAAARAAEPVQAAAVPAAAPDASAPALRTSADPFGDVGFHEVNEKAWLAGLREK